MNRIKTPKGNQFVIPDIHGCVKTLKKLVQRLNLTNDDQLFFLGDYIDRGPNSKGVLDYIIELETTNNIFAIRGNHEEDIQILVEVDNKGLYKRYFRSQTNVIFNPDYSLDKKYLDFIKKLPYFYELESHLIVHAGFDFTIENPLSSDPDNLEEMVWLRSWEKNYSGDKVGNKTIIHGHVITPLNEITENINKNANILPLDNGCVYPKGADYGNLLCFNITKNELIIQENIE